MRNRPTGLLAKASLRLRRPLIRISGFDWRSLPRAWSVFAQPLAVLVRYLEIKAVRPPWRLAFRGGPVLRVSGGEDILCAWDCWVKEEYPLSGDERLIVDAGANIGAFALYASHRSPGARIFALEPVASTRADLAGNVEANGLAGRITVLGLGVAGRSGKADISLGGPSVQHSMYGGDGPRETVDVAALSDLLEAIGNPPEADFLKLDCEGAEMACLLEAGLPILRRFRRIGFEYHVISGHTYAQVSDHLRAAGFREVRAQHHPEFGTGLGLFERE